MKPWWLLPAIACGGCVVGAAPPPQAPVASVPSASAAPAAPAAPAVPDATGGSAPDRHPPSLPAASAGCTSRLHGSIASHTSGGAVPAITIAEGERLCVEIEHDSERITSARVVESSGEPDRTIVLSLDGDKLSIDNPFGDLLLHYSLVPKPKNGRVCPTPPQASHVEELPADTAKVTLSNLHFKGHGTAGSELCM